MPDYGKGSAPTEDVILAGGNLEYNTVITGEISAGTWSSVGYTAKDAGGVLSVKAATFTDVKVTGLSDPVKRKAVGRDATFKANLVQMNMDNLAIVLGDTPAAVASGKYRGGKSVVGTTMRWRYTVPNDDAPTKDKRLYMYKARVEEAVEIPFADEKESQIALTLTLLEVTGGETPAIIDGGVALTGFRYQIEEGSF
jgi:hypothetical protein